MTEQFGYKEVEASLIKNAFLFARDIHFDPTNLGFKPKSVGESINFILRTKIGSCSAKHYLLGQLLQNYAIQTKYLTYPFYWHDLPVRYPDELKNLLPELPIQYHLALKVVDNDRELLLDATWDVGLRSAEFPVNELSDPIQDTILGIIPCGDPIVHLSPQDRWDYIESLKQTMPKKDVVVHFYKRMSEWLNIVRNSK